MIALEPAALPVRQAWLERSLPAGARLGLDPWLHSATEIQQWQSLAAELGFTLEMLTSNPVDSLWTQGRLAGYHRTVLRDLEPLLDQPALQWLETVVRSFAQDAPL